MASFPVWCKILNASGTQIGYIHHESREQLMFGNSQHLAKIRALKLEVPVEA